MSLLLQDPKLWRGRAQLYGVARGGDRVDYVQGPKIGKWTWDSSQNPLLHKLEAEVYQASLNASDRLQQKKQELVATGRYTPAGIKDELRAFAAAHVKPTLERAKAELETAQRSISERRAKVKAVPPAAKPDDAVTAMRKMEARTVLRGMGRRQLVNLLAGENPDPLLLEAALETPAYMVPNIDHILRKHIEQAAIDKHFGPELEQLDDLDNAINDAAKVASVVAADITRELQGIQAVPTVGEQNDARRERAEFVDQNGHEKYFNRGSAA